VRSSISTVFSSGLAEVFIISAKKGLNEVRIIRVFNYSFPYCLMVYFTAVQLQPWEGFSVCLLSVFLQNVFPPFLANVLFF